MNYVLLTVFVLVLAAGGAFAQTCDASLAPASGKAAVNMAHDRSVEAIIKVARISVGSPKAANVPLEITFRNLSSQPVTAFEFGLRVQYAEGEELTDEGAIDFLKAWGTTRPANGTNRDQPRQLAPGAVYRTSKWIRLGPDGQPPIRVEAYPVVVVLADRTGLGDRERIADIGEERGAEAEDLADTISDLNRAQSAADPTAALSARIAQLRKNRPQSGPYFKRATLLDSCLVPAADGLLQSHINILVAQRRALAEGAALVHKQNTFAAVPSGNQERR